MHFVTIVLLLLLLFLFFLVSLPFLSVSLNKVPHWFPILKPSVCETCRSSVLVFSLSSHRHSYIGLVFSSRFIDSWQTTKKFEGPPHIYVSSLRRAAAQSPWNDWHFQGRVVSSLLVDVIQWLTGPRVTSSFVYCVPWTWNLIRLTWTWNLIRLIQVWKK